MSVRSLPLPWIAALLLYGLLTTLLLVKEIWRKCPLFFAYCLSSFVLSLGLFAVYYYRLPRNIYFDTFWFDEALGLLLGLGVVYEIFRHVFAPYPALRRLAGQCFQAAILLLIVLGCIVAYCQPLGEQHHMQAAFLVVEQATRILEVGLLLFLFVFAGAFGLHWRQYIFGMALGLGIYAAVELVAVTMRVQFGMAASPIVNMVRSVSFNSSLLIWIGYILAPDLAANPAEMPKRAQLEQWNRAIMELIYQ